MKKPAQIDLERFSAEVKTKRGKQGLREVATEIGGVSAPTLSRIEQGNVPDLDTYIVICKWLGKSPKEFTIGETKEEEGSVPKIIEARLRADKTLPKETVDALSRMIELAYEAAKAGKV